MATIEEHVVTTFDYKVKDKELKDSIGTWQTAKKVMEGTKTLSEKQVMIDEKGRKITKEKYVEARRFRAELLSVMFLGMQMSRVFGGEISRVWELVGGTERIKAFWTEALVTPLLKISEKVQAVVDLIPDMWKEPIGYGAIAITGVAKGLEWMGNIWLGLRGIEDMFGVNILDASKKASDALDDFGKKGSKSITGMGFKWDVATLGYVLPIALGAISLIAFFATIDSIEKKLRELHEKFPELDMPSMKDIPYDQQGKIITEENRQRDITLSKQGMWAWLKQEFRDYGGFKQDIGIIGEAQNALDLYYFEKYITQKTQSMGG